RDDWQQRVVRQSEVAADGDLLGMAHSHERGWYRGGCRHEVTAVTVLASAAGYKIAHAYPCVCRPRARGRRQLRRAAPRAHRPPSLERVTRNRLWWQLR